MKTRCGFYETATQCHDNNKKSRVQSKDSCLYNMSRTFHEEEENLSLLREGGFSA